MLTCFCSGHCPDGSHNGTCIAKAGQFMAAKCFSAVEEVLDPDTGDLVPERTYGCMPPEESGLLQCKGHLVPHLNPTSIACCSDHMCNRGLLPTYEPTPVYNESTDLGTTGLGSNSGIKMDVELLILLVVSFTIVLVIIIITMAACFIRFRRREDKQRRHALAAQHDPEGFLRGYPGTLRDMIEETSGSGSGIPLLMQKTIAKEIQFMEKIGQGRYGEVWLAKWRGENIAVKMFFTHDEASWYRECEIYQTVQLRHENILGFIAEDIRGAGGFTQMLLLTEYHPLGSLFDFLQQYTITCPKRMGTLRSKPAMAHRDIKTRNILVRSDYTCVLADFGLAVRYSRRDNKIDVGAPNQRVGTIRYMSPEALDQTMDTNSFKAFQQADIYSVGLVMWEILRRTETPQIQTENMQENKPIIKNFNNIGNSGSGICEDYRSPYYDCVGSDPKFDEMHQVVCIKEMRPQLEERWRTHPSLFAVSKIAEECWSGKPMARPTSLRLKLALGELLGIASEEEDDKEDLLDFK